MPRKAAKKTATKKDAPVKGRGTKKATPKAVSPLPRTGEAAPLMVTISGIRGIAGEALTPAAVLSFVEAFAQLAGGPRIVLGHDARPSSHWILPIVEGVLRAHGIDVIFVGLAPTPTVGLLTRKLKASGGIVVTASHNPIAYNGLKFFQSSGEFITGDILDQLRRKIAEPPPAVPADRIGMRKDMPEAVELHMRALLNVLPPPERQRASKAPKVIIDACNSTGAILAPDVADAYGAVFQMIHADTKKYEFPREAEPLPENITRLCKAVVKEGADLGFAIDPDGDRLALVDENGVAIGEERTLVLAADAYFSTSKRKSPIVVNLATTRAIDDLAARHRVSVYRTAIGEANVLAGIKKHRARIGGEGNGGVIFPQVQPGRDSAVAIALILTGMQARGESLSTWNKSIPDYVMVKEKLPIGKGSMSAALKKVRNAFSREKVDSTDGIKITMADRWLQVRPSNTEPIVRIFAEAPDENGARELIDKAVKILQ